jgi:hypothetical protein
MRPHLRWIQAVFVCAAAAGLWSGTFGFSDLLRILRACVESEDSTRLMIDIKRGLILGCAWYLNTRMFVELSALVYKRSGIRCAYIDEAITKLGSVLEKERVVMATLPFGLVAATWGCDACFFGQALGIHKSCIPDIGASVFSIWCAWYVFGTLRTLGTLKYTWRFLQN